MKIYLLGTSNQMQEDIKIEKLLFLDNNALSQKEAYPITWKNQKVFCNGNDISILLDGVDEDVKNATLYSITVNIRGKLRDKAKVRDTLLVDSILCEEKDAFYSRSIKENYGVFVNVCSNDIGKEIGCA